MPLKDCCHKVDRMIGEAKTAIKDVSAGKMPSGVSAFDL